MRKLFLNIGLSSAQNTDLLPLNLKYRGHTTLPLKKDTNPVSVETLQDQIRKRGLHNYDTIVGLGGKEYRQVIEKSFAYFNKKVHFPFAGLPIGKAMQATKKAIEAGILIP